MIDKELPSLSKEDVDRIVNAILNKDGVIQL